MSKPKRNYKPGKLDDCQTPGYALDPVHKWLLKDSKNITIWECASGDGLIVNNLRERGFYNIIHTDIKTGFDFLTEEPDFDFGCIITNPPYSLKFDWIERCYELNKPWALLLPVETIGAAKAQKSFSSCVLDIGIIYMSKRVNFKMPNKGYDGGGAQFPVAWYVWGWGLIGNHFWNFNYLTKELRESYERLS